MSYTAKTNWQGNEPVTEYDLNRWENGILVAHQQIEASTAVATQSADGLQSSADKIKLDGIASGANNYVHPITDGNKHVPTTGTSNNKRVLKAGATAGEIAWGDVDIVDVNSIQSGTVSITPVANVPTSVTVTFKKTFRAMPIVVATGNSTGPGTTFLGVSVSDETTTSVTIYITRTNAVTTSVRWIAMEAK